MKNKTITEKNNKPKKKPENNIPLGPSIAMVIAGVAAGMVFQYLLLKTKNESKKAEGKSVIS